MDFESDTTPGRIIAIGTANPLFKKTQSEVLEEVLQSQKLSALARELCRRFFNDHGIQTRYFGLERIGQVFEESQDEAIQRFQKEALDCAASAIVNALSQGNILSDRIDGLIVTTCTGYLCPGLSTYIAGELGLRKDIFLLDLVGQGCGAAGPALQAADHFLKAHPNSVVVAVSVEICSAAFSHGEEIELLISNAIFGDGAAAAVLTNNKDYSGLELQDFESILLPQYRDDLKFKTKNSRLCNVISSRVPVLAAQAAYDLKVRMTQLWGQPQYYAFHGGGRAILDRIQETIGLGDRSMDYSRAILRDYGNMSSPSIFYVLKNILDSGSLKSGDTIFAFTFGAGFSAHSFVTTLKPGEMNGLYAYEESNKVKADSRCQV